tara:strand:- start:96 stop:281 length:186 start_codon:yes stop_codon:yes gene_type:complete
MDLRRVLLSSAVFNPEGHQSLELFARSAASSAERNPEDCPISPVQNAAFGIELQHEIVGLG